MHLCISLVYIYIYIYPRITHLQYYSYWSTLERIADRIAWGGC